jgi:tetratricopeptide (TPR) repeat protein
MALAKPYDTWAFFDQTGIKKKTKVRIIGKTLEVKNDRRRIIVKLFEKGLAQSGEKLYILDKRKRIIGQLRVKNTFTSFYFGPMLSGTGHFHMIPKKSMVAQPVSTSGANREDLYQYLAKAENYYQEQSYGESIRYYKKALSIASRNAKALLGLGLNYYSMSLWQPAQKHINLALKYQHNLKLKEDRAKLYELKAEFAIRRAQQDRLKNNNQREKQLKRALKWLDKALKLFPSSAKWHYQKGRLHYLLGSNRKALESLRASIQSGNGFLFECHWYIARIFRQNGMRDKALKHLRQARKIRPHNMAVQEAIRRLKGD